MPPDLPDALALDLLEPDLPDPDFPELGLPPPDFFAMSTMVNQTLSPPKHRGGPKGGNMLVVTRHRVSDPERFLKDASAALTALAQRPGCESAEAVRAIDDADTFLLVTRWADVGSYRRALSSFDVKLNAVPVMAGAADEPSAFETILQVVDGEVQRFSGDLAPDAGTAGPL